MISTIFVLILFFTILSELFSIKSQLHTCSVLSFMTMYSRQEVRGFLCVLDSFLLDWCQPCTDSLYKRVFYVSDKVLKGGEVVSKGRLGSFRLSGLRGSDLLC